MNAPGSGPKTVAEIDSFITMLGAACSDRVVYERLEALLSLPDEKRKGELHAWITDMLVAGAPTDFVAAIACLMDDAVAEKAYEVIYDCRRG